MGSECRRSWAVCRGRQFLTQDAIENLADRAEGQAVTKVDVGRNLVRRKLRPAESHDVVGGCRGSGPEHDARAYDLAVIGVRDTNDRRHAYGRMLLQHGLDLRWVHVEAIHEDHVLLALNDARISVLVNRGDVAGVQPETAVGVPSQNARRFLGLVPVTL